MRSVRRAAIQVELTCGAQLREEQLVQSGPHASPGPVPHPTPAGHPRMRGLTRSLALERDGNRLVSRSAMICGFVRMQGAGAYQERLLLLRGTEIRLRFDDGGPDDPYLLDGVLGTERAEVCSGVTIGCAESFDTLQLWLATMLPRFRLLALDAERDFSLVAPGNRWFNLAAVGDGSFPYLTTRPSGWGRIEFGVHAFGPHAPAVVEAMAEQVRV